MAKHAHPLHEELRGRLRELGLRATGARLAALRPLHDAARPLTHAELMEVLEPEGWDRATIYRVLSDLSEAGLLRRMDLGDHIWRFELLDDCRTIHDDHAHFMCLDCGEVTCLPELELRAAGGGALPPVLQGADLHLKVTGRCAGCVA
ncbi:MAG: transcriptional repressor [Alphaproteobacteria bacterium]|nr:transcriptional repressor [Alphaproteobacteria bacterium]MCB9791206.1 transcriptional repressor [Alphaproteobacteria bacterium]